MTRSCPTSRALTTACMLLAVAFASTSGRLLLQTCPPPGFDSVANLNVQEYIQAPWYVQQQMPVVYQPVSQLYCVRANHTAVDPSDLSKGIIVYNYADDKKVNGSPLGDAPGLGPPMIAFPDGDANSSTGASKLAVGLMAQEGAYLGGAKGLFGPYWVVAVGTDPTTGHYAWAIVSGGPPTTPSNGACRTGPADAATLTANGDGLWLFSRTPVDPQDTAVMVQQAKDLGFDTSVLQPVQQQGCTYAGANGTAAAAPAAEPTGVTG